MPADRTGSVERFKRADGSNYYRVRVRLADGTRERVDIPSKHAGDEGRRAIYASAAQEREDETGELLEKKRARLAAKAAQRDPTHGETCTAYRDRLNDHRVEIGTTSKGGRVDDESTWNAWLAKPLGSLPIAKVTREDVEKIRDTLDAEIAKHRASEGREGLSSRRAANIWTVVTTTFKATVASKRRDLRVRTDNPCAGVLPPERGESKRRTFIQPAELAAALARVETPLAWREAYAIGAYLYLRPGELRALTWGDVDLVAGVAHVTKAYDERTGDTKAPKTGNGVRDVPIPASLVPLLQRMRRLADGTDKAAAELVAPVLGEFTENGRAVRLRAYLRAAGVTRPRLFENTATTMGVNFRSLRDSGITWLALSGVDAVRMQRRAGHDDIKTTLDYVKQAEDIGGNLGVPFGPLPPTLLEGVETVPEKRRVGVGIWSNPAKVRAKVRAKQNDAKAKSLKLEANLEAHAELVSAPVFKMGGYVLHGAAGGFDSHVFPQITGVFERFAPTKPTQSPHKLAEERLG